MTNDTTLQRLSTYYGIRCIILLLIIQFINIFFCNGAYAFKGVSIPVWSDEITEEIELTLHKEKLSKYIEIADDEVLKDLKKSEEKIEERKQALADAQRENKSEEELKKLREKIENAKKAFRESLFKFEREIKIILKEGYPGPIYFPKRNFPVFCFNVEGGITEKIRINELKNLSERIEAKLIVKDKGIEVTKESDKYRLIFDKARDVKIKFEGKLKGKADLKFGISPQIGNPITFLETKAPAGKSFKIKIPVDKLDKEKDRVHVYFLNNSEPIFSPSLPVGDKQKPEDSFYIFKPMVPDSLKGKVYVTAFIIDKKEKILKAYNITKFRVSNQLFAFLLAAGLTILVIYLIALLIRSDGKRAPWWAAPLDFTVTPLHRYSISLLQILIWTTITIFSYIYVYWIRGQFIHFTEQILTLLGISGATALSAKAIAVVRFREIPDKYYKNGNGIDLRDFKRKPNFSDYVCIGNIPNLFKFQMLGFTIITAIIVIKELIKTSNFPVIPNGLLKLMGISAGTYVGNEVATENVWAKIKEKVDQAEEKFKKWQENLPEIEKLQKSIDNKKKQLGQLKKVVGKEAEVKEVEQSIVQEEEKLKSLKSYENEYTKLKGEIYKELEKIFI